MVESSNSSGGLEEIRDKFDREFGEIRSLKAKVFGEFRLNIVVVECGLMRFEEFES